MESIHLKTVDPTGQDLLKSAARRRIPLVWERYERLQPQDGFLRLGLSCPYGCMQGPCRIDPFGRGADQGICGLQRDAMVAAFLLRLTLQGALELRHAAAGKAGNRVEEYDYRINQAVSAFGSGPISDQDLTLAASMLRRPSCGPTRLVAQAFRLGLLALRNTPAEPDPRDRRTVQAGYGVLAGATACVAVAGRIPENLIENLAGKDSIRLVSLGEWIASEERYLPVACSSGEAELALSSGRIAAFICGPDADPALTGICETLNIPMVSVDSATTSEQVLNLVSRQDCGASDFCPDAGQCGTGEVSIGTAALHALFEGEEPVALMGGSDCPRQSLGWIATEAAPALRGCGIPVVGWGDAATWMIKGGMAGEVGLLAPDTGLISALRVVAGRPEAIRGICFTGIASCGELTTALGLSALGMRVCIATPLPVWGSSVVCELLEKNLAGGALTSFDHPAQAQEILEWFIA